MSRRALGRGLDALFPQASSITSDLMLLAIDSIDAGVAQPRRDFDEARIEELAQSIQANGIIQPVIVRRVGERFQIVAGERRWRAAKKSGLEKIPCVIREAPDDRILELSLIENIQRQELNPIEEAQAYRNLQIQLGLTQEELARRVGKERSSVANSIRLLRLPEDVQRLVAQSKLSMGHARSLLSIESEEMQISVAAEIVAKALSVRETERLVRAKSKKPKQRVMNDAEQRTANVVAAEAKLSKRFGAPVKIKFKNPGGVVEIGFASDEDLSRLFELLVQRGDPRDRF